jgi:ABC-type proline/glycine betaine transport system ATPase subunit
MTSVLVTHDIDEAVYLSDRVIILTPSPATIHTIYQIPLPRPRNRVSEAFGRIRIAIRLLCTFDADGDIVFKYEGGTYVLRRFEEHPTRITLLFPAFWRIESVAEQQKAESVANFVNARVFGGKVCIEGNEVVFALADLFLGKPSDLKRTFMDALQSTQSAV